MRQGFSKGLSRASLSLKAVNALLHDFSKEYEIRCKWETEFQIFRGKAGLSANSKQSYKYDLEQFLDIVGERISDTSLKIYQAQLANLKISAKKRKISACNQFLLSLSKGRSG